MFKKVLILVILSLIMLSVVSAVPSPCSENQLYKFSDFAIKGLVVNVGNCSRPYDVISCRTQVNKMVDCIAYIKVTESIKGNYSVGDIAKVTFPTFKKRKTSGNCVPGPVSKNFFVGDKVVYYNVKNACVWSNTWVLKKGFDPFQSKSENNFIKQILNFFKRLF